jgi:hypothetical protein
MAKRMFATGRRTAVALACRQCGEMTNRVSRGVCHDCRDARGGTDIEERDPRTGRVYWRHITAREIDAHLDNLAALCAAGIHPSAGRKLDGYGEVCGACQRRVRP